MSLLDANSKVIQECNVVDDESNYHVHVQDAAAYKEFKTKKEKFMYFLIGAGAITVLMLSIFAVNFGPNGLNMANIMLITLGVLGLNGTAYLAKQYMNASTQVDNMENEGRPCYVGTETQKKVYC